MGVARDMVILEDEHADLVEQNAKLQNDLMLARARIADLEKTLKEATAQVDQLMEDVDNLHAQLNDEFRD